MDVIATIIAHEKVADALSHDEHRFVFELREGERDAVTNVITLRTARVLARELRPATAFTQMVVAIVDADEAAYDALIGRVFVHA